MAHPKKSGDSYELYFAIVVGVFALFAIYYFIKLRTVTSPRHKGVSRKDLEAGSKPAVEKKITAMYVPKDVGHRTGHKKVFITNKGLRVYETNEQGLPVPSLTVPQP